MVFFAQPIERLLEELEKLPGVGPKTAQRLAYWLLTREPQETAALAQAMVEARSRIRRCRTCFNLTDAEQCWICSDPGRDSSVICVVEEPRDVVALERTHEFRGLYHVLHGAVSPIDNVSVEDLTVDALVERVREGGVTEVIVATNPTLEGETTATILARLLRPLGVSVTRLASGLPMGGDLEFADEQTLGRALTGRREI
jgi:recombination protein RecR